MPTVDGSTTNETDEERRIRLRLDEPASDEPETKNALKPKAKK
jgi:hypothetical protein